MQLLPVTGSAIKVEFYAVKIGFPFLPIVLELFINKLDVTLEADKFEWASTNW